LKAGIGRVLEEVVDGIRNRGILGFLGFVGEFGEVATGSVVGFDYAEAVEGVDPGIGRGGRCRCCRCMPVRPPGMRRCKGCCMRAASCGSWILARRNRWMLVPEPAPAPVPVLAL
jgi:hypothetical protein